MRNSKLFSQRGFAVLEILIILAVLVLVGFLIYRAVTAPRDNLPVPPVTEEKAEVSDPYSGWKQYDGPIYSFKYPEDWQAEESFKGDGPPSEYDKVVDITKAGIRITLSPFQYPYGFTSETEIAGKLSLVINGMQYSADGIRAVGGNGATFDFEINIDGLEHHVLMGITDYASFTKHEEDHVKQMMKTLEIK